VSVFHGQVKNFVRILNSFTSNPMFFSLRFLLISCPHFLAPRPPQKTIGHDEGKEK